MISAITKEILLVNNFIIDTKIETIYIGGGTPSLLSVEDLHFIFNMMRKLH
jgi:oxygen-independent coproporphyrinogen III oxidase